MRRRAVRSFRQALHVPGIVRQRIEQVAAGIELRGEPAGANAALSKAAAAIAAEARTGELDADAIARRFHRLQDTLERAVLRDPSLETPVEVHGGAQSKHFMLQLVPYVHGFMSTRPKGEAFRILDVGPGAGHGSNLLGSLYAARDLGYSATVTTLDTNPVYEPYLKAFCRYITPKFGSIFAHRETYDIVIASHVVEHVKEPPIEFCRRLRQLARGIVIVCAPYNEPADALASGHRNVLDDAFLEAIEPITLDLLESPAWGWFRTPRYRMFVAVLRGEATT